LVLFSAKGLSFGVPAVWAIESDKTTEHLVTAERQVVFVNRELAADGRQEVFLVQLGTNIWGRGKVRDMDLEVIAQESAAALVKRLTNLEIEPKNVKRVDSAKWVMYEASNHDWAEQVQRDRKNPFDRTELWEVRAYVIPTSEEINCVAVHGTRGWYEERNSAKNWADALVGLTTNPPTKAALSSPKTN
jgi:hypothetical protein